MGEARAETEKIIAAINANQKAQSILNAENWHVVFQFNLSDEDEPFYIEVQGGEAMVVGGTHQNPTLLITGSGNSVARASRGQGDFTHSISREEIEVKAGKVMELIRYGRAIAATLKK
ncbi:MAG TPA: hypothetical protein VKK79_10010 [Candidatus Lokiarchaeia archaeon]|nr:hypothetical protein [Candidatus Lokiarchaeia archaeon]